MPIIVNGTTINDYSAGVNVNGTAMQEVNVNGTRVWTRYPYPVGTTIFTYAWNAGSNINNFITSIYATYPLAFAGAPFYTKGGGAPDSDLRFTLASGFQVSSASNSERGTDPDGAGAGNFGGVWQLGAYQTFTGIIGITFPLSPSTFGNGSTSFTVKYIGN
jgi:hypothetical protein